MPDYILTASLGNGSATLNWGAPIIAYPDFVSDRYLLISRLGGNFATTKVDLLNNDNLKVVEVYDATPALTGYIYSIKCELENNFSYAVVLNVEFSTGVNPIAASIVVAPVSPPAAPVISLIEIGATDGSTGNTFLKVKINFGENVDYVRFFAVADGTGTVTSKQIKKSEVVNLNWGYSEISLDNYFAAPTLAAAHIYAIADNHSGSSLPSNTYPIWLTQNPGDPVTEGVKVKNASTLTVSFKAPSSCILDQITSYQVCKDNLFLEYVTIQAMSVYTPVYKYVVDITGLDYDTSYTCNVRSVNSKGTSNKVAYSPTLLIVPAPAPVVTVDISTHVTYKSKIILSIEGDMRPISTKLEDGSTASAYALYAAYGAYGANAAKALPVFNKSTNKTTITGYIDSTPDDTSFTLVANYTYINITDNTNLTSYTSEPFVVYTQKCPALSSIDYDFSRSGLNGAVLGETANLYPNSNFFIEYGFYFGLSVPNSSSMQSFKFGTRNEFSVSSAALSACPNGILYGVLRSQAKYNSSEFIYSAICEVSVDSALLPPVLQHLAVSPSCLLTYKAGVATVPYSAIELSDEMMELEATVTYITEKLVALKTSNLLLRAEDRANGNNNNGPAIAANNGVITTLEKSLALARSSLQNGPPEIYLPTITGLSLKVINALTGVIAESKANIAYDPASGIQITVSNLLQDTLYIAQLSVKYIDRFSQDTWVMNQASIPFSWAGQATLTTDLASVGTAANVVKMTVKQSGAPMSSINILAVTSTIAVSAVSAQSAVGLPGMLNYQPAVTAVTGVAAVTTPRCASIALTYDSTAGTYLYNALPDWITSLSIVNTPANLSTYDITLTTKIATCPKISMLVEFINMSNITTVGTKAEAQTIVTSIYTNA
jgi:hypothetical protein